MTKTKTKTKTNESLVRAASINEHQLHGNGKMTTDEMRLIPGHFD